MAKELRTDRETPSLDGADGPFENEIDVLGEGGPWGAIALDAAEAVVFATPGVSQLLGCEVVPGMSLASLLPELDTEAEADAGAGAANGEAQGGRGSRVAERAAGEGLEVARGERWLWLQLEPREARRVRFVLRITDMTASRRTLTHRAESLRFLSHDLRSPQNSIVALTQLHEYDRQAFDDCGGMQRIAELARYALSLGDQFIFTSVAGALQHRDFARFDLRVAVRSLIPKLDVAAVFRSVALRLWIAEDPPVWVSGVPVFVMRALQNIIDNAVHASAAHGRVTVSLKVAEDHAVIVVSDEAGGLPGLTPGRPMTDFDTLGPHSIGGFGIGLKLAARIVVLHGGTLHAQTNNDAGTTFVIRLPLLSLHRSEPGSPADGRTGLGYAAFERPPRSCFDR